MLVGRGWHTGVVAALLGVALAAAPAASAATHARMGTVAPDINVGPTSIAFGNQQVGTASGTQTVTIGNTGAGALHLSAATVSSSQFEIYQDNCGPYPKALTQGQSCTLLLRFTPQTAGAHTANLTISSDDPDPSESPVFVGLSGTGRTPPNITFDPTSLDFGSQEQATTSAPQTLTIGNDGQSSLTITGISKVGDNPGDFALNLNPGIGGCGSPPKTLVEDGTCDVSVTFTPAATGSRSAALRVLSSDPDDSPHDVALSGTGTTPLPLPDASIRRSKDAAAIGDDVYENPPTTQISTWAAKRGKTRAFLIGLENDGTGSGPVTVQGCVGTPKFKVAYFADGIDVTAQVTAGTYATTSLAPGADAAPLELRIKPKRSRGKLACNVSATAGGEDDVVQAKLKAKR